MSNSVKAQTRRTKRSHMSKHQRIMREKSQSGTRQGLAEKEKNHVQNS